MEIQDRSPMLEELIFQLWERGYFATLELASDADQRIEIVSHGQRNLDGGPDFKNVTIKLDGHIHQGDLEIHRSGNDWYLHQHHHDPAYNNVILHLVIGSKSAQHKGPVCLNQNAVLAEAFVNLSDEKIQYLTKKYKLSSDPPVKIIHCKLQQYNESEKLAIIEHSGLVRFRQKAERFSEQRFHQSWSQIIYSGMLEALGYSKNCKPFRKLAQLIPVEVVNRELQRAKENPLLKIQAFLYGVAGLLPSQDPRLAIRDEEILHYVEKMEKLWQDNKKRIGIEPMRREEWQFFRLRPVNFPTRRLAGACLVLSKLLPKGVLESLIHIFESLLDNPREIIKELESLFLTTTTGYWSKHYVFETQAEAGAKQTLIGKDRSRDIIVNIILPSIYAYAGEIDNGRLKSTVLQVYRQYPKLSTNVIIKGMIRDYFQIDSNLINTALKQQGLIHLHKMYCAKNECERCMESVRTAFAT
ncbi:DUF2851 family protein [candidate division KSB1 bacterium]|nr:DUF2851 family protein [candidate division KSB1 bacterium]